MTSSGSGTKSVRSTDGKAGESSGSKISRDGEADKANEERSRAGIVVVLVTASPFGSVSILYAPFPISTSKPANRNLP